VPGSVAQLFIIPQIIPACGKKKTSAANRVWPEWLATPLRVPSRMGESEPRAQASGRAASRTGCPRTGRWRSPARTPRRVRPPKTRLCQEKLPHTANRPGSGAAGLRIGRAANRLQRRPLGRRKPDSTPLGATQPVNRPCICANECLTSTSQRQRGSNGGDDVSTHP
jgi:hypothetical protein